MHTELSQRISIIWMNLVMTHFKWPTNHQASMLVYEGRIPMLFVMQKKRLYTKRRLEEASGLPLLNAFVQIEVCFHQRSFLKERIFQKHGSLREWTQSGIGHALLRDGYAMTLLFN